MKKIIFTACFALIAGFLVAADDNDLVKFDKAKNNLFKVNDAIKEKLEDCTVTSSQTTTVSVGESTITINAKCTKTAATCKEANTAAQACANDRVNKSLALVLVFTGW